MPITSNKAWRAWGWRTITDDQSGDTIDLEMRSPSFVERTRLESLEGLSFAAAVQDLIKACVRAWAGVLAPNDDDGGTHPIDFSHDALFDILGQFPGIGRGLFAEILGRPATETEAKNVPTTPGTGPAG